VANVEEETLELSSRHSAIAFQRHRTPPSSFTPLSATTVHDTALKLWRTVTGLPHAACLQVDQYFGEPRLRIYHLRVHAVLLLGLGLGLELAASSVVSFSMYPRLGRGLAANFSEDIGRRAPSSHDGSETPREKGTRNQIIQRAIYNISPTNFLTCFLDAPANKSFPNRNL
jgi:hypothetical protein